MDIFKWFKNDTTKELEQKVTALETIISNGSINKSLMGIDGSGNVQWYNTGTSNSYESHYTIYRGIDMLASLGAGLSVNIYKNDQIMDPNFKLSMGFDIHKPHPNMSLNQVLYTALVYFFYRGEFMIEISDDPMFHLIPINPKHMERVRNSMDWKYSLNGKSRIISEDNLIYVQLMNPDNASRGLSPVDVVKADLTNESSAINYNTKFFENFGQVGGFFYDSLGKAHGNDLQKIVDQFDYIHKGAGKAYKTLGLPGGIRYEDFSQTMRELQYLESRKDIRDRILAVLGIHKALFGVTDQVNRSVSEEATRMLWIHNLKPKMIMIQDKINQVLFRRYFPGYLFKYNFSEIAELREAAESIMQQVTLYQALGYTTNEINERFDLGMEEMDDERGNIRLVPSNFIPMDDYLIDDSPIEDKKSIDMSILDDVLSIEDKSLKVNRASHIRKHNKIFRASTKRMTGKLGKFFSTELGQVTKLILSYDTKKSNIDINTLLSEIQNLITNNKQLLQETMRPLYIDGSLEADEVAIASIGATAEPVANEIVVAQMTNKITNISNHTYRLVRTQIKNGIEAGDSIDMLAKRVQNVYKMNSSRARTIARTESGGVIHKTTDLRYKDAGVTKKQWLNTKDGNSRDSHSSNANLGAVDYNYTYPNGQQFPGDSNGSAADTINCRCTFIGVI
jgi:HK97 family phage portal protein